MTEHRSKCPDCGAALPPIAPAGFCPKCLLEAAREETRLDIGKLEEEERFREEGRKLEESLAGRCPLEGRGAEVDRYQLLEKIGEGAFGSVWAAEQREPVKRRVALKIIKLGMDTNQVVARFEAERQALALMDHPHIAKVLDGGSTGSGRPYFVMELVRGIPITQYCQQEGLEISGRVELFIKVCQAVQHSHQKGIIHRDLKPSNVLVTTQDGMPVPKVIDFGISKATSQALTDKTIYTHHQQFIGTPAYMSPEQAEMSPFDIDTRSDIYSLGAVLYELLTGMTPFDGQELLRANLEEVRRIIREREPLRPSVRRAQARGNFPEAGMRTGLTMGRDLDCIVMKCLEKCRSRRYETVSGLIQDLQRHLRREPVTARPPSPAYKLGRFIQRHKLGVAAGLVVTLALVLGLGTSTLLLFRLGVVHQRMLESERNRVVEQAMFAAMSGNTDMLANALVEAEANGVSGGHIRMFHGQQALALGEPGAAIEHLLRARSLLPDSVAVHALLATAYVLDQKWRSYEEVMARIPHLTPSKPEDYLFMGQTVSFDDPKRGLELLDEAVRRRPSLLAIVTRGSARATHAADTGRLEDIESALEDLNVAKAFTSENLAVLLAGAWTYANAALLFQEHGRTAQRDLYLALADSDGLKLERFAGNPVAMSERILQLELAGREEEAFAFMQRLVEDQRVRHPLVLVRYGGALLKRGEPRNALRALDQVYPADDFLDSVRIMALLELPERRMEFEEAVADFQRRYSGGVVEMYSPWFLFLAGEPEKARAMGRLFYQQRPDRFLSWREHYKRVARFFAGELLGGALLETPSRYEICDAHFLIAVEQLAAGDRSAAITHLRQAVSSKSIYMYEYLFARIILARLEADPAWPPWIPAGPAGRSVGEVGSPIKLGVPSSISIIEMVGGWG